MGRPTDIPPFRHKKANSSSMTGIGWMMVLIGALAVMAAALGMIG